VAVMVVKMPVRWWWWWYCGCMIGGDGDDGDTSMVLEARCGVGILDA